MTRPHAAPGAPSLPIPPGNGVDSPEAAGRICARIEATMDALLQLIEAESELLRTGKTIAAAALESAKNHYASAYMAELDLLREIGAALDEQAPGSVERLRHRHEEFVSVLQIDLAALATARAVAEPAPAGPRTSGRMHRPPGLRAAF